MSQEIGKKLAFFSFLDNFRSRRGRPRLCIVQWGRPHKQKRGIYGLANPCCCRFVWNRLGCRVKGFPWFFTLGSHNSHTLLFGKQLFPARAMKTIPLGTAYAVWTGIGTVGAAVFGIVLFGEPVSICRVCFISLILVGIIGLKLVS